MLAVLLLLWIPCASALGPAAQNAKSSGAIPAAEFSRMVRDFPESGGYFQSDNFTSNETAYLYVIDRLKEKGIAGGAYVGVGPE